VSEISRKFPGVVSLLMQALRFVKCSGRPISIGNWFTPRQLRATLCLCPHACSGATLMDRPSPFARRLASIPSYGTPFLATSAIVSRGQESDVLAIGDVNEGSTDNSETLWG